MMCSMRILILVSGEAAGFGFTNSHCSTQDVFVGSESRHYDPFPTSQLVFVLIPDKKSTLNSLKLVNLCLCPEYLAEALDSLCNPGSIRFYVSYNVRFCNHNWFMMCPRRIFIRVFGEDRELAL